MSEWTVGIPAWIIPAQMLVLVSGTVFGLLILYGSTRVWREWLGAGLVIGGLTVPCFVMLCMFVIRAFCWGGYTDNPTSPETQALVRKHPNSAFAQVIARTLEQQGEAGPQQAKIDVSKVGAAPRSTAELEDEAKRLKLELQNAELKKKLVTVQAPQEW